MTATINVATATDAELLNHYQRQIADFAKELNLSYQQTVQLLNGDLFISDELAERLVQVMGALAFNLETKKNEYRASLDRLRFNTLQETTRLLSFDFLPPYV